MYYLYSSTIHPVFQLTTSRRGRQDIFRRVPDSSIISTHDLTKRSTTVEKANTAVKKDFNSRPREEVDRLHTKIRFLYMISTHDLTKRSTEHTIFHHGPEVFQLTTSRRGRHSKSIFQRLQWHFNSRPHEEVDERQRTQTSEKQHFNSRPHEEVDLCG